MAVTLLHTTDQVLQLHIQFCREIFQKLDRHRAKMNNIGVQSHKESAGEAKLPRKFFDTTAKQRLPDMLNPQGLRSHRLCLKRLASLGRLQVAHRKLVEERQ